MAAAAILLFLALSAAAGGRWERLQDVSLGRAEYLVVVLWLAQSGLRFGFGPIQTVVPIAWAAVSCGLGIALYMFRSRPGFGLLAMGVAANSFVVALNGGMPVLASRSPLGETLVMTAVESNGFYHLTGSTTLCPWLGDVLPTPAGSMASAGDLLMLLGVGVFLAGSMIHSRETSPLDA